MSAGIAVGIAVGQIISTVFFVFLGYFLGRLYTRDIRRPAPAPPAPRCLCGHAYGTHEGGYKCKAIHLDKYNIKIGDCACRLYVGPDPLASGLWHPPIKDEDTKGKVK